MLRNTHWMGIGALSIVAMGIFVAGCGTQNSNPDNVPGAPANTAPSALQNNTATGAVASATASTASFDDAANTWSRVEEARAELDTAVKARKLDQVHASASKIRDLVKTLPDESSMLPEDKRKTLDAHVKNVGELAAMMDKSDDPSDMKPAQEHQIAMNDALDMIKGVYPTGAMQSSMHMPNMSSSGKGMPDGGMPGKGMGGKMGGMDGMMGGMGDKGGKMSGMGKPTDPGKKPAPNAKPMPSGGMGGDM